MRLLFHKVDPKTKTTVTLGEVIVPEETPISWMEEKGLDPIIAFKKGGRTEVLYCKMNKNW